MPAVDTTAKKSVPAITNEAIDENYSRSVLMTPKDYFRSVTSPGREDLGSLTVK